MLGNELAAPPLPSTTQIPPSKSKVMRPSIGETSALRLVPSVSVLWANEMSGNRQTNSAVDSPVLARTIDLYFDQTLKGCAKSDLHWLTTDLAIFNIGLVAGRRVDDDIKWLVAKRAAYSCFLDWFVHGLIDS